MEQISFRHFDLESASDFSKFISIICMILVHAISYSATNDFQNGLSESIFLGFLMGMTSNFLITSGISLALKNKSKNITDAIKKDTFNLIVSTSIKLIVIDFLFQLLFGLGAEGLKYGSSILTIGFSYLVIIFLWRFNGLLVLCLGCFSIILAINFQPNVFELITNNDLSSFSISEDILGWFQFISYIFIVNTFIFILIKNIFKKYNNLFFFFFQFALILYLTATNIDPKHFKFFYLKLFWGSPHANILFPFLFWLPKIILGWLIYYLFSYLEKLNLLKYQKMTLLVLIAIYSYFPFFSGKMETALYHSSSFAVWISDFNSKINFRIIALSFLFNFIILIMGNQLSIYLPRMFIGIRKASSISLYLYLFVSSSLYKVLFTYFHIESLYVKIISLFTFYFLLSVFLIKIVSFLEIKSIKIKFNKIR